MIKIRFVLFLTILSSVFTNISAQDKVVDQIIAVVGGKPILLSDIENQNLQLKQQGYESNNDAKCEILEDFMYQKLLINQAELDSIEVTSKEVDDAIEGRFRYFVSQIGSVEKLEAYFNKSVLEMKEDMRSEVKDQLLSQKMQSQITESIKITPAEVRAYFKEIPADSIPFIDTEIELEQITVSPVVSDAEHEIVKEKLNGYRERILKGDKFSTLARLYSEDPGSSKNGGELGFVSRNDLVPEFAAVAFNLKDDEVSRIVKTQYGYHIIQLIEKKGEMANIRHILLIPKVSIEEKVKASHKLDSIATLIRTSKMTFAEAAEKFSDDKDTKSNGGVVFNQQTGTSKFETSQIDPATYYAIKTLKINEISNPFESQTASGSVYKIVRLKSKTIPHKANLKDDYQKIQDLALEEKKTKAIDDWTIKKRSTTYIQIDESFANCNFRLKSWVDKK